MTLAQGAPHSRPLPARGERALGIAGSYERAPGVFVTGTDTGVGKTWVAVALLRALAHAGFRAVGMKPVAAGIQCSAGLNEDVIALRGAASVDAPLCDVNPYVFADPIAPHVAAAAANTSIEVPRIVDACARLRATADALVVEGAGGALAPIDRALDMLDIAAACELPVLLVVGMRLGCLNHALLSALAVQRRGLALAGWIANELPPGMPFVEENVETLTERLGRAPAVVVRSGAQPLFDAVALATLGFGR